MPQSGKGRLPLHTAGISYEIAAKFARSRYFLRRPGKLFSHQPLHDSGLQGTAAGTACGIYRRAHQKFSRKKTGAVLRADAARAEKNDGAIALLPQKPWRVFAGQLNLTQLAAVIQHSALHFCGDTGTLHLAAMTKHPPSLGSGPTPACANGFPLVINIASW